MRWHWPPENSCGRRPATASGSRPTASSTSSTLACCASSVPPTPRCRGARRRCRSTRRRGFSDEIGSWKIICMPGPRPRAGSSPVQRGELVALERAPTRWSGGGSCMIARPVVDLPQPDSPTRPSVSPSSTSKLMSTRRAPCRRAGGNSTTRCSTRSSVLRRAGGRSRCRPSGRRSGRRAVDRSRLGGDRGASSRPRAYRPGTSSAYAWPGVVGLGTSGGSSSWQLVLGVRAAGREAAARRAG